jgi:hypothetical protein
MNLICFSAPYDYCHDRYQAYYREGIRRFLNLSGGSVSLRGGTRLPLVLKSIRRLRYSFRMRRILGKASPVIHGLLDDLASLLSREARPAVSGVFHSSVGQYIFQIAPGEERRVCIDAQDSGEIGSQKLLDWCDIYFKTNYWKDRDYPPKVVPMCNGNPLLLDHLDHLRGLRTAGFTYDLCFIVRVWGGTDETEGIEHNLRLLETVAQARCKKFLLAYLVAGDIPASARRLERQGIAWTTDPLPLRDLWRLSAQSRLNVLRLGMHHCVPWRMMDVLAMGGCPVLDRDPYTLWPQPLERNQNYLSLDAAPPPGDCVATESQYAAIPERIGQFLADAAMIGRVRQTNQADFDRDLEPLAVGRQICQQVLMPVDSR